MSLHSLLHRRVSEVIDLNHLQKRLESGEKLRVKLGVDPSAAQLHIGHAVTLRKLREFQDAGHTAVLIIGDYTAQIGDPTDRSAARTMLTPKEVKKNAEGYLEQVYKIIDPEKTEVHFQSEWFGKFSLRDVIELMAATTVNHLLSHETFGSRIDKNQPLYVHEILYPLLQGYDSVKVEADVELGGMDQKFNILMGRNVQRAHNMPEQDIMLITYLPGTDGQEKMSKSLNNAINLTDSPEMMYGKVMSIPDSLIAIYFELATQIDDEEVTEFKSQLDDPKVNPRNIKAELARIIVEENHGAEAAQLAAEAFDRQFRQKQIPDEIETLVLPPTSYALDQLLTSRSTLVASKSEFRRLVSQRGVRVNGQVITDPLQSIDQTTGDEVIIQIGSRRFLKVVWK